MPKCIVSICVGLCVCTGVCVLYALMNVSALEMPVWVFAEGAADVDVSSFFTTGQGYWRVSQTFADLSFLSLLSSSLLRQIQHTQRQPSLCMKDIWKDNKEQSLQMQRVIVILAEFLCAFCFPQSRTRTLRRRRFQKPTPSRSPVPVQPTRGESALRCQETLVSRVTRQHYTQRLPLQTLYRRLSRVHIV